MRYFRLVSLLLSITVLLFISALFASCGGGGGGGGGVGPTYVNSRATGTYRFVMLDGGFGATTGNVVFDGAGNGTWTALQTTGTDTSGAFTYTVTTDNTITLDGEMTGTMRGGGNFLVSTSTVSGSEVMLLAVKLSSGLTDTANTYVAGQFSREDPMSSAEVVHISMADAVESELTWSVMYPASGPTGTADYTFDQDGSFSLPMVTPNSFGAITPDYELMIMGDAETVTYPYLNAICGFKTATSATLATLNGTYIMHEFMDGLVIGGGKVVTRRGRVVFDGAGNGTYTVLAASNGPTAGTEPFTYVVQPGGTFQINFPGPPPGTLTGGVVLQDGSVFGVVDYDQGGSDNTIGVTIGVRQP
jgi:hypothetical protein